MSPRIAALLAAAPLLLLTACGGGEEKEPEGDATSESTPLKGSAQCHQVLPQDEAAKLMAGDVAAPKDTTISGLDACIWHATTNPTANVTVVRAPADQWAQNLVPMLDQYDQTGAFEGEDKKKLERVRELLTGPEALTAEQACEVFDTIVVEVGGAEPDEGRVVLFRPTEKPQVVNVQTCEDGTYTSLQLLAPGLKGSKAEEARLLEAYDALP